MKTIKDIEQIIDDSFFAGETDSDCLRKIRNYLNPSVPCEKPWKRKKKKGKGQK